MIKTGTIKVKNIKVKTSIKTIKIIIKTLITTIIIIMMMIMTVKTGHCQLPVGIINFDSYYHHYYYQNLLFTVLADVKSL